MSLRDEEGPCECGKYTSCLLGSRCPEPIHRRRGAAPPERIAEAQALAHDIRAAIADRYQGALFDDRLATEIRDDCFRLITPHRGVLVPWNVRVVVVNDRGNLLVDIVDVDEERARAEAWMAFFRAWTGADRILDGIPLTPEEGGR